MRHGFMINDGSVLEFLARKSDRNPKPVFSTQFPVLSSTGLLHRGDRVDEVKELFDACDLERVLNSLADADEV
jgi:hypothetical protein